MAFGVDYAFNPHPSVAALKAAGVQFVVRYTSAYAPNDGNGKNLLPAEYKALRAAGFDVAIVAEESAGSLRGGFAAGKAQAQHADAVAKALGMPGVAVYLAADWDATPGDQAAINAACDGAASVVSHDRTGIYGGYYVVKRTLDAGKAKYAWQTIAWSGGQWDPRANMRQGLQVSVGGVLVDPDHAYTSDYGQWPRPDGPSKGTGLPGLQATARYNNLTATWDAVPGATHYGVLLTSHHGSERVDYQRVDGTSVTFHGVRQHTGFAVHVVARPADAAGNASGVVYVETL